MIEKIIRAGIPFIIAIFIIICVILEEKVAVAFLASSLAYYAAQKALNSDDHDKYKYT